MSIRFASIALLLLIAACDRSPVGDASSDPASESVGSGDSVNGDVEVVVDDVSFLPRQREPRRSAGRRCGH